MDKKLTPAQRKALETAYRYDGTITENSASTVTLRNLQGAGLLRRSNNWHAFRITEHGMKAIGRGDEWDIVHYEILLEELKLIPIRHTVQQVYYNDYREDYELRHEYKQLSLPARERRYSDHLDIAIEIARLEIRYDWHDFTRA